MKQLFTFRSAQVILLALGLCLLTLVILQLDSLEKRLFGQAQELRALGESTERVARELGRLQSGAAPGGASAGSSAGIGCDLTNVRHPGVKDFLGPKDTRWPPAGAATDGTLFKGWPSGDPKGFNPLLENSADVKGDIINYTDLALADRNKWTNPDTWYGELACRVEITDDYKEFTIYLRKGVVWHKPAGVDLKSPAYAWLDKRHEVTAQDLVFAFDMLMHPQVENGFAKNYYEDLESWKALDDHTVVVRWKKKLYGSVEATLSMSPLPRFLFAFDERGQPIPKETQGIRFNQHWYNNKGYVGTGPYRLSEYVPGNRLVFDRNEDFFGDKPAIARVVHSIYTDPNTTLLKLKAGELSLGGLRPGQYREEILRYQGQPRESWPKNSPFLNGTLECKVVESPAFRYLGWNTDKPLFSDARVRTAMTLALNRKAIIENVFAGLGEISLGPFLPGTGYLDPSVDPLDFNLERAKKLLTEAGFTDSDGDGLLDKVINGKKTPFEFSLLIYGTSPEFAALANIYKEDLLKLGVKLNVTAAEWSLMQKRMDEKTFDAFTGGWQLGWDTDPFQLWHSSQADIPKGSNRVGFRNKEADKLIEQLRETFNPEERRQMLRRVHRLIYDAQPYTFILNAKGVTCWQKSLREVSFAKVSPLADYRPWWVAAAN